MRRLFWFFWQLDCFSIPEIPFYWGSFINYVTRDKGDGGGGGVVNPRKFLAWRGTKTGKKVRDATYEWAFYRNFLLWDEMILLGDHTTWALTRSLNQT